METAFDNIGNQDIDYWWWNSSTWQNYRRNRILFHLYNRTENPKIQALLLGWFHNRFHLKLIDYVDLQYDYFVYSDLTDDVILFLSCWFFASWESYCHIHLTNRFILQNNFILNRCIRCIRLFEWTADSLSFSQSFPFIEDLLYFLNFPWIALILHSNLEVFSRIFLWYYDGSANKSRYRQQWWWRHI